MACVELKNITKTFGNEEIIHQIDLRVEDGEFVVFVGPSGCGKSTLLRLIAGLEEITDGTLEIDGEIVNELSPKERGVGMVFQSYALYPHMNVFENIAFGLKLGSGAGKEKIREWVQKTADVLQLGELLHRKPRELSGGQRQRVAIGRAMAREPRIMLFDEPLSNLDASLRVQMRNEIAKLHNRLQSTMIYVTHDQVEAMTLADKIVVLNKGHIEQVGSPFDLYENPESLFVAGFIGSPKMNLLPGTLAKPGADTSEVALDGIGPARCACDSSRLEAGATVTLGIRPEHLQLRKPGPDDTPLEVMNVEYLGNEAYVYLDVPGASQPLVVRQPVPCPVVPGQSLVPVISVDSAHLFDDNGQVLRRTRAPAANEVGDAQLEGAQG
ncbi:sn-glycerol-3-phosphate ABC transporter ATP-binding protein UgpC [Marinobacter halodurans]|uniref:Sn-glycerol-3-phosphate ABC transporter ATP-binding protein UgpC n=1 Tax=Marinobacter halodurans TaxID=2528979 RepID=A0ABY1ZIF4_9GAMM|nr:sn-glycerol-3-phosphate ABC transporter ATP-binding protein UgpC [Marinobacter halodurans]TBW51264.1 sn-glycerol-3-phosphate ABC transporter ATP-binding protein UgpC [Marinobacter halodurans]